MIHGSSVTGGARPAASAASMITAPMPMFRNENTSAVMPVFETNLRMYARLKP